MKKLITCLGVVAAIMASSVTMAKTPVVTIETAGTVTVNSNMADKSITLPYYRVRGDITEGMPLDLPGAAKHKASSSYAYFINAEEEYAYIVPFLDFLPPRHDASNWVAHSLVLDTKGNVEEVE